MRWAAAMDLVPAALQRREVELRDRLVDQPPLVLGVEHLADEALCRLHREARNLAADLIDRARRLGVDLLAGLVEPPLTISLRLLADPRHLRVRDLARLRQDLGGLRLRLPDQRAMLLEQLA